MPARFSKSSDADQASLIQTVGFLHGSMVRVLCADDGLKLTFQSSMSTEASRSTSKAFQSISKASDRVAETCFRQLAMGTDQEAVIDVRVLVRGTEV